MKNESRKTALITGATSGIGAAFAEEFARRGYDLIITGRRKEKINKLADEMSRKYNINVEVIIIELSNKQEVEKLVEKVKNQNIDVLINNAGFGIKSSYYESNFEKWERMLDVHVTCPMKLVHAVLPNMKERGSGTIINVSSLSALLFIPENCIYSATKSFLKVFTETLHLELRGAGIRVQALCPGFTKSDFHEKMGMDKSRQVNKGLMKWQTPQEVVDISLKYLEKDKIICVPGFSTRAMVFLLSLLPRSVYNKIVSNNKHSKEQSYQNS